MILAARLSLVLAPWGELPSAGWQTWPQSSGLPGPPRAGVRVHTATQGRLSLDSCSLRRRVPSRPGPR